MSSILGKFILFFFSPWENPRDSVLFYLVKQNATLTTRRHFCTENAIDEDATSISRRDGVLREKRMDFSRDGPYFL